MKRIITLAFAVLACILSGCSKNEIQADGSNTIRASVAVVGTPDTKAIMQDQPGVAINVFWEAGDHIGIFGEGGSNVDFVLSKGSLSKDGRSAVFETSDNMPKGDLLAYYPYSKGMTKDNGALSLIAPAIQKHTGPVPRPDPASNIMLARGTRGGGLLFQPVFAILKIGKIFEESTNVKRVEFRDLAGKPVCGEFSASFSNGKPVTEYTGSSDVLTLDCGTLGKANKGETKVFFMFVPARSYPKGYEITFVTAAGNVVQTVGASTGKTLQYGTVYNVGDITKYETIKGVESEVFPEAIVMSQKNQDRIQIQDKTEHVITNDNGDLLYDNHDKV